MFNTPQMDLPEYQEALKAFNTGSAIGASRADLQRYLVAIASNATGDDAVQARDTIQALTLNHLVLQRHIDTLEQKNKVTQYLVIGLTVASLIGTIAQAWLAYKADARTEAELARQISAKPVDTKPSFGALLAPTIPSPTPSAPKLSGGTELQKSVQSDNRK